HNFALFIWFGTGLLGLVSLMMLYCAILKECAALSTICIAIRTISLLKFIR
ncbi:O-antigen ligase RfaL, partial [Shigella flexneri]|nr:O-antigen ligase RfaL [Shigella flexneri]